MKSLLIGCWCPVSLVLGVGGRGDDGTKVVAQGALFYEFLIEGFVPQDHPMRGIDRFLVLTEMRPILAPYDSSHGRPSIDLQLMIHYPAVHVYMRERAHAAVGIRHGQPLRAAALRRDTCQSAERAVSGRVDCSVIYSRQFCSAARMKALSVATALALALA